MMRTKKISRTRPIGATAKNSGDWVIPLTSEDATRSPQITTFIAEPSRLAGPNGIPTEFFNAPSM